MRGVCVYAYLSVQVCVSAIVLTSVRAKYVQMYHNIFTLRKCLWETITCSWISALPRHVSALHTSRPTIWRTSRVKVRVLFFSLIFCCFFFLFMRCHELQVSYTLTSVLISLSVFFINTHRCFDRNHPLCAPFSYINMVFGTHSVISETCMSWKQAKVIQKCSVRLHCGHPCADGRSNKSAVRVFGANSGERRCNHWLVQLGLV